MNYFKNLNKRVTVFVLFLVLSSFALSELKAQETYTLQTDSLALVALYNATNGPGWTRRANWLTGNLNTWAGVTVSVNRVTSLSLTMNKLSGSIPPELGTLTNLTSLYLAWNQLSGPIPPELGRLSKLYFLDMYANSQISGTIPPELGNLTNLTSLTLGANQLNGPIPSEFGRLSNLQTLDINQSKLSGSIPHELGSLYKLSTLVLYSNQLTGVIPIELGNLSNLRTLNLHNNKLSGSIPSELGNLSNLQTLHLGWNQLTGTIPLEIGNLLNLQTLDLFYNQLSGSIPSVLGNLLNLKELDLHNSQISGSIPPELGSLSNLKTLILNDNQLSGTIPSELTRLSKLITLNIGRNQLIGSIPTELGSLLNLQILDLSWNEISGSIPPELGDLSKLTYLNLGITKLTGSIPPEMGDLSSLTYLSLFAIRGISGSIPPELGRLSNLKQLTLSANHLSGSIPKELGDLLNLRTLQLCDNRLSGSIPKELGGLANLGQLDLYWNQLSGNIPKELGNLSELGSLNLYMNQLSGNIPPELGNLSKLGYLQLNYNQLSGTIPKELGSLSNLIYIYIDENQLSGTIPSEWGELSSLQQFVLNSNQFGFNDISSSTILPNGITRFRYAPQAKQPAPTQTINGRNVTLTVGDNHPANHYAWYVNGVAVAGNDASTFTFAPTVNTTVYVKITNDVYTVPGSTYQNLVLQTEPASVVPVVDATPPNVIVQDINIQLNELGTASITAGQIDNGSNDAFGIASMVVSTITFECSHVGANTVTLTVTDTNGNASTGSATITVQDTIAPALTVPANIAQLNDAGICGATINIGQAVATDNCSIATLTNNAPAFFPVGLTIVTWTATDLNGNTTTATQTVEITDTAPVISGLAVSTFMQADGSVMASATHADNNLVAGTWNWGDGSSTASDIAGAQISGSHIFSQNGLYNVTLTIEDTCGATDTKAFEYLKTYNRHTDSLALVAFYNATNGSGWTNKTNWLTGRLNTWYGVKVVENRVIELTFYYDNNMTGFITPELGNLSKLTLLYLGNNQISGTLPPELGNLFNLTNLTIYGNKVSGNIPPELGNLSNLTQLSLSENQLSGSIPPEFGRLANLTSLSLGSNQISGSIPPELGNLANLRSLYLSSNQISGLIPSELERLTKLTYMGLGYNQLSGSIPPQLGNLSNLVSLYLYSNQLSGSIPKELGNLANLVEFYLYGNQLSGSLPPELGLLSKLGTFYSSSNRFSGSIPKEFGGLLSLSSLFLDGNELSGSIPPELGNLSKLQVLFLRNNKLSGSIPPELGNLSNLGNLNLRNNQLSGTIPQELGKLSNLTGLYLGSNQLTGTIPQELGSLSKLTTIHLINNQLSGPIPSEWGNLSGLSCFQLYQNKFGFNDIAGSTILPNEISSFQYAPQGTQPALTQMVNGKNVTLTVADNHPANHYTWYVNGVALTGYDASNYTFAPTVNTMVYVKITNDVYTDTSSTNQINYYGVQCSPGINQNLILQTEPVTVAPVIDATPPTVIVQDITLQLNELGTASITAEQIGNGSNDAFGIASMVVSPTTFECSHVGANTVTLTVTDTNGNASTGSATITVRDTIAPVAIVQNVTIQLDATGTASITAAQINNGSTDACGIASMEVSKTAFDCSNVGINTVVLTVTDTNGNVSTGSATITVQDTIAPVAIAQNVTIQLDATGTASITADQINNGSTDACGIASLVVSKTAFDCSNVGTNTVVLIVTDVNGNASTGSATITVQNTIAPVAIAQNVSIQLDATGAASITAAEINNGSTDACGIASMEISKTAFDCSNVGTNSVVLTVTDVNGNVSTASATITVEDNIAPVAIAQNIIIQLDATGAASISADQINNGSTDACGIASLSVSKTAFDCSNVGTNPVVLTITDVNGNASTGSATITVQDNIAPVAIAQNVAIQLDATGAASITAAQVNNGSTDGCGIASLSISKTAFDCSNVGTNTVVLTVADVNGNASTDSATITVQDNIAPVAIAQNITIQLDATGAASITAAQINNGSTDGCGIASMEVSKTTFDCSNVGTNTVVLTVTDVNGNASTGSATITVQDNIAPVAIAQNITIQLDATGTASITAAQVNNGSTDGCGIASMEVSKTTFDCSNKGTNTVVLTVTDVNGNASTGSATITVQDNIAPVAIAQNITIQLDATGAASITAAQINNGSTDGCGIASMEVSKTTFDCSNVGTNTVVLTVTDVNGNASTGSATITVEDNIAPVLSVSANIVRLTDPGVCGAAVTIGQATATDNCSIATVTNNAPAFFPLGTTNVVWTVVDPSGNTTTGIQMVEIINNAPVIGGFTVSTLTPLDGTVTASATHADNNLVGGTWNWGDGTTTVSVIIGTQISGTHIYSQPGLYNVTLTIEDACGLTDTEVYNYVTIYNPCNGFVTGGGYINTPARAYAANPSLSGKSNYGFNAKYKKGEKVPSGEFNFHFNSANFQVKATSFDWLMVNNEQAILKGLATVNGQADYHFIASVVDGNITAKNGTDYLRLIVWDNSGNVLYDNQNGDPDQAMASNPIDNGQIVIHKAKNGNCYSYEDEDDDDKSSVKDEKNENVKIELTPVLVEMKVYPNPVFNYEVTISIENFDNSTAKVDLTSLTGQVVYSAPKVNFFGGRTKINFKQTKIQSGNYLLRVSEIGGSRVGVEQIKVIETK